MEPNDFDALWDFANPDQTESKFRQLLPPAEQSGDQEYLAQLLTQLARTLGLQRHFEEAHTVLDRVESLVAADYPIARTRYLLERGRTFNSGGDRERAMPLFSEAWELAQSLRGKAPLADFYAVDAAHMLAIAETGPAVMTWNLKALNYARASDEPKARNWLGSLLNNIAWTYHDQGDYTSAQELFEEALDFRISQNHPAQTVQIAKWAVARGLRSLGQVEAALASQRELLVEVEDAGDQDGFIQEEIGECLLLLDQPDNARSYFDQAFALLSQDQWLVANEPARLERLKSLAQNKDER
jgi:tetratricopeptide (TPR) repeat protein